MNREKAIAFFKDMNECTYGNLEEVEMAIASIEQVGCLTGRPCDVCRFKNENGCNRWECVFKGV